MQRRITLNPFGCSIICALACDRRWTRWPRRRRAYWIGRCMWTQEGKWQGRGRMRRGVHPFLRWNGGICSGYFGVCFWWWILGTIVELKLLKSFWLLHLIHCLDVVGKHCILRFWGSLLQPFRSEWYYLSNFFDIHIVSNWGSLVVA